MLTPVPTKRWNRACTNPGPRSDSAMVVRRDAPTKEYPATSPSVRIAQALRQTTLRAHEVISSNAPDARVLRDLQFEVSALETEADRLGLRALRPFLKSLRHRIEAAI